MLLLFLTLILLTVADPNTEGETCIHNIDCGNNEWKCLNGTCHYIPTDPTPTGGANCTHDIDCGGINAGVCLNGVCHCPKTLAKPDCSYERWNSALAGGLNIGLPFVGVGGVGNLVIGNINHGVGQLILMAAFYVMLCPMCCLGCLAAKSNQAAIAGISLVGCAAGLAILAGFIWSIAEGGLMLTHNTTDGNGYYLYH